jgi:hypothetical protein
MDKAHKPHRKGHIETIKFITMDEAPMPRRSPVVATGTYEETTAHTSTTKKIHLKALIGVKPQEELFRRRPFCPTGALHQDQGACART